LAKSYDTFAGISTPQCTRSAQAVATSSKLRAGSWHADHGADLEDIGKDEPAHDFDFHDRAIHDQLNFLRRARLEDPRFGQQECYAVSHHFAPCFVFQWRA
jgi:hypothetical protein